MREFSTYFAAERAMLKQIITNPEFVNTDTNEILCAGFVLPDPAFNENGRSNYEYAQHFFEWMLSGDTDLTKKLTDINPWAKRFVDKTNLPETFSATYGHKIKAQLPLMIKEMKNHRFSSSRRAYITILSEHDHEILKVKTTHEFPCTIGLHFLPRGQRLNLIVNMRSNNVYSVLPYDVYNFTKLQIHVAKEMGLQTGKYYHQMNSAHVYHGDIRRINEGGLIK